MANPLNITAAESGKTYGLHGDMQPALNFTPDDKFEVGFFCMSDASFTITSSAGTFRQIDGTTGPSLTIAGWNRFVELMFNTHDSVWEMPRNNLVGGSGTAVDNGDGTVTVKGDPGIAATLELGTVQQVAYDAPYEFTMTGPSYARVLNIKAPGPAPANSGGTGTGPDTSEHAATILNGVVTFNKAVGLNFRVPMDTGLTFANPVGYSPGDRIKATLVQGTGAPFAAAWGDAWGFDDGQQPRLATLNGGINKVIADLTAGGLWTTDVFPTSGSAQGYASITPIARNGTTLYYRMGGTAVIPQNTTALGSIQPGQTVYVIRNGKGGEVTGTVQGAGNGNLYVIAGQSIGGNGDQRPLLKLGTTDFATGGANRPSFGKALINLEGSLDIEIRDLRLADARNSSSDARGIALNDPGANGINVQNVTVRNVDISNCNNGMLTGNATLQGTLSHIDVNFYDNGVGGPDIENSHGTGSSDGYVHTVYTGHNNATFKALRSSYTGSKTGHNLKSRSGYTELKQVFCKGAMIGRELNLPNGGKLYVEDSWFWKVAGSSQGNLISIGEEGVDLSRPREYTFVRTRLQNDNSNPGTDTTFIINFDHVSMTFIDPQFVGDIALSLQNAPSGGYDGMVTANGIRYWPDSPPTFVFTNGVPPGFAADKQPGRPTIVNMTPAS